MAAKKFYAVKKGKITGVFDNWNDCKASVDGYPGAEYKGFATLEEAREYMGIPDVGQADREGGKACADAGIGDQRIRTLHDERDNKITDVVNGKQGVKRGDSDP